LKLILFLLLFEKRGIEKSRPPSYQFHFTCSSWDQRRIEVDTQQPLNADESGYKDRLWHSSLGEDDGVRPKRSAPSRFPRLS
jgi:hypothetical protein